MAAMLIIQEPVASEVGACRNEKPESPFQAHPASPCLTQEILTVDAISISTLGNEVKVCVQECVSPPPGRGMREAREWLPSNSLEFFHHPHPTSSVTTLYVGMRIPFIKPKLPVLAYSDLWDGVSRDMLEQLMLLRVVLDDTFEHSYSIPEPSLLQAAKSGVMRMEMQHPILEYPAVAFEAQLLAGSRVGYDGVSFVFSIKGYRGEQIGEYSYAKLKQQGFTRDIEVLRGWVKRLPLLNVAGVTMAYLERSGITKASALQVS